MTPPPLVPQRLFSFNVPDPAVSVICVTPAKPTATPFPRYLKVGIFPCNGCSCRLYHFFFPRKVLCELTFEAEGSEATSLLFGGLRRLGSFQGPLYSSSFRPSRPARPRPLSPPCQNRKIIDISLSHEGKMTTSPSRFFLSRHRPFFFLGTWK